MKEWEKQMREDLEKNLPNDSLYYVPGLGMQVNKASYIEVLIGVQKDIKDGSNN